MSVAAFLQEFNSACDACSIYEGAAMWLFRQFLTSPAEAAVKRQMTLLHSTNFLHEGPLKSYSAIVQFILKRHVTYENIARLDAEVCKLRQGPVVAA